MWLSFFLFSLSSFLGGISDAAKGLSLCKTYPGDLSIEWECRRTNKGETFEKLFGERWQDLARVNRIDRPHARAGVYLKFPKRPDDLRDYTPLPRYFEPARKEDKFILIDLSSSSSGHMSVGNS